MAKRREFEIALLAVLTAALPGCAGKSIWPSWSSSKSSSSSQSMEELTAKNSAATKPPSSFSNGMKKTSDSIVSALTIKPKVIPAKDPTALDGKPTKLGPEIYVSAARIHENRGDMDAASAQYKKALELAPKDVSALVGLARLHDRQGQFAEAETLYKKAAEANPKSPLVWNDLGLCYARQKRLPEATSTLSRAVQLQPNNAMYRNNVATVLVEQGRLDEAWTQLSAVNDPATAHYNMGYLLHQHKHDGKAGEHLEQALVA
ncbi:MAG TPA: tetratricopeptide repeat protein, partial [Pirellulaceae bacterium]|nr:tetratricopeptide repeat protein [Pirellulaceae bacterium]